MLELPYSFHIENDKNKTKKAKQKAEFIIIKWFHSVEPLAIKITSSRKIDISIYIWYYFIHKNEEQEE